MKIQWEKEDIKSGIYLIKNSSPIDSNDYNFAMSVLYKIGFTNKKNVYCLISMTDGMIMEYTKMDLLKRLNECEYGYRQVFLPDLIKLLTQYFKNNINVKR